MSTVFPCEDWRDIISLNSAYNLYLKPSTCITISVQFPPNMPPAAVESISTEEIMEKIQSTARPDVLVGLKVLKTAQQYVRIEAHVHNKQQIPPVLERLDRSNLKLKNFDELLKVRACEAKISYATKQDWESFFHLNRNFYDMKPGERPDTIHLKMLPSHWFTSHNHSHSSSKSQKLKPSESILRTIFESFGPVRSIDIPMLDPYRPKMFPNLENTYMTGQDGLFDAYVQFQEYGSFLKCMTAFRGMILVLREGNKAFAAPIQVDFDRTRHLSERSLKYRKALREKLIQEDIDKERADKLKRGKDGSTTTETRHPTRDDRFQVGEKITTAASDQGQTNSIELEERKLILAQRRLESLRLLDAIVEEVKVFLDKSKQNSLKKKSKKDKEAKRQSKLEKQEKILRAKLLKKYQQMELARFEEQRDKLQKLKQSLNGSLKPKESIQPPIESVSSEAAFNSRSNSPHSSRHVHESERVSNGTARLPYNRERQKPLSYRSNYNQSYDRRNDNRQGLGNYHKHNTFNRKRYQTSESFNSPTRQDSNRQDSNRQDWKRGRFDTNKSKPNWQSNFDSELWDGPEVEPEHQSARSSFRRGGRNGGDFHHRPRNHSTINDQPNMKVSRSEFRNSGASYSQNLPDPIERPV